MTLQRFILAQEIWYHDSRKIYQGFCRWEEGQWWEGNEIALRKLPNDLLHQVKSHLLCFQNFIRQSHQLERYFISKPKRQAAQWDGIAFYTDLHILSNYCKISVTFFFPERRTAAPEIHMEIQVILNSLVKTVFKENKHGKILISIF